jgi:TadE-like protein
MRDESRDRVDVGRDPRNADRAASVPEAYPRATGCICRTPRNRRQKGSDVLEFTLVLLPMLAMLFVLLDTGWAIFAKSTLQRAVQIAVHSGVNMSASQLPQGLCLTDAVKSTVQQNSLGLLSGASGLGLIKVNYLMPPAPSSSGSITDVSNQAAGDSPGNIMQVSVQNFWLQPLLPRIFGWNQAADNSPMAISVYAADMIEPSPNTPCMGTAP